MRGISKGFDRMDGRLSVTGLLQDIDVHPEVTINP